jgi:hypothetical protein
MKVKKLIEELQKCDPDALVVLAVDAEGNGYNTLGELEANCRYKDGEVKFDHLTEVLKRAGFCEEDVMEDGELAVLLWP